MSRATVARGLRLLASLVAGDDPVADALAEVVRAQRDAARALELAKRADGDAAAAEEMAMRTREVVAAMLREGPTAHPGRRAELLRDLAHPADEPPTGAGGDD